MQLIYIYIVGKNCTVPYLVGATTQRRNTVNHQGSSHASRRLQGDTSKTRRTGKYDRRRPGVKREIGNGGRPLTEKTSMRIFCSSLISHIPITCFEYFIKYQLLTKPVHLPVMVEPLYNIGLPL